MTLNFCTLHADCEHIVSTAVNVNINVNREFI